MTCGCASAVPPSSMAGGKKKQVKAKTVKGGAITRSKRDTLRDTFTKSISSLASNFGNTYEIEIQRLLEEVFVDYENVSSQMVDQIDQSLAGYDLNISISPICLTTGQTQNPLNVAQIRNSDSFKFDPSSINVPLTMTKMNVTLLRDKTPIKQYIINCYNYAMTYANDPTSKANYDTAFKVLLMALKSPSASKKDKLAHFWIILSTLSKSTFPRFKDLTSPEKTGEIDELTALLGGLLGQTATAPMTVQSNPYDRYKMFLQKTIEKFVKKANNASKKQQEEVQTRAQRELENAMKKQQKLAEKSSCPAPPPPPIGLDLPLQFDDKDADGNTIMINATTGLPIRYNTREVQPQQVLPQFINDMETSGGAKKAKRTAGKKLSKK